MQQIFDNAQITNEGEGQPDAIVETDDHVFVLEFTVEWYRIASLYNTDSAQLSDDLHKLLFNEGANDPRGRAKDDQGKFYKLDRYVEQVKEKGKKIIPVLVTENHIGDYDLINGFDSLVDTGIHDNHLTNLQDHKPMIISLDDLETLWGLSTKDDATQKLAEWIESWEQTEKGPYHFNFSYFMSNIDGTVRNEEYIQFFDF